MWIFFPVSGQYNKLKSPFEWEIVARNLVAMASMGLIFFCITLLCEFNFFIKPRRLPLNPYMAPPDEDQDVANERKRTLRGSGRRDLLRLENLTKVGFQNFAFSFSTLNSEYFNLPGLLLNVS